MAGFGGFGDLLGLGTPLRLLGSQDSPDAWREGSLQYRSLVGPEQQSLFGPLAQFYQGKLNSSPTDFLNNNGFGQTYFNALLGPSFNDFMNRGLPAINSSFANIGGTLSSRRQNAITAALGGLYQNAQSQYIQAIPGLMQLQYLPAQEALKFALSQTQQTQEQKPGSGLQALSGFGASI